LHGFNYGKAKGQTTHFPEIDEIFRFSRGEVTVLHGMGNHGKSTILNQLLINRAELNGERFCYFSPEQYPASDFYDELVETYIGGSVSKGQYQVSKELYYEGIDWLNRHFFYIYPEDRTPQNILNTFSKVISKHKVDGVIIDPWNQMEHDFSLRDDQHLSNVLTMFKKYALAENIYFIILAHPRGGLETKGDGNYKMPYYTHLAGGMMWGNKCDNILCYHRPNYRTDPKDTSCILASQKIKRQKYNGRPGFVEMEYKPHKSRFYINDFNPLENPKDPIPTESPFEEIADPMLKLRNNGFEEIPF
jgi:twinkle protein